MKKLFFTITFLFLCLVLYSQKNTIQNIADYGVEGLLCTYHFDSINTYEKTYNKILFKQFYIKNFTFLKEAGKPALPVHYELVLIPDNAKANLTLKKNNSQIQNNILLYPALHPATDRFGDPEPEFTFDTNFYRQNTWYPETPVKIIKYYKIKGLTIALIQICPVMYNPQKRTVKIYKKISFDLHFNKHKEFIKNKNNYSKYFLHQLLNVILNHKSVRKEIDEYLQQAQAKSLIKNNPSKNYIIITHNDYRAAADTLAKWKSQLGYRVEIVSRSVWTSPQIKSEIEQRYNSWTPKPDYVVFIGDHDKVPGMIRQDPWYYQNFATDLYYVCMDGPNDYIADMAFGRISVSNAVQALNTVRKIINYEKKPPTHPSFYTSGTNCAYFQDDDQDSYEDRRFVLTCEELRNYMISQGFIVDRVYKTSSNINPLYYNNGYFANSEPLPSELLRPVFGWNGNKNNIIAAVNAPEGRLFLVHRDHGYVGGTGWATPEFTSNDIDLLTNTDKLPVVFSINCHTGEYQLPECFAEKMLRKNYSGAAGVFAAAYYSYSGFNDAYLIGLFDAIWANPGCIPNFSGTGDNPIGTPQSHQAIFSMGDVMNQGKIRMVQTWGDDRYSQELYHYFGDPAMKIWTQLPASITATHDSQIQCLSTSFHIFSSTCTDCLATLVVDGQLIASATLTNGQATLHFPPVAGSEAILTLSKHNYKPYIVTIPFASECVKAKFTIDFGNDCIGQPIIFSDASVGTNLNYTWNFGVGANPPTANTQGPHQVIYNTPGMKIISLTVHNSMDTNTFTDSVYISQPCIFTTEQNKTTIINACQGILLDNGGYNNYFPNSNDTIIIIGPSTGNTSIFFTDFDIEEGDMGYCNYDYLKIFDGPNTSSTLIGTYCSSPGNIPPTAINATGNALTLVFFSDGYTSGRGYEINFNCSQPGTPPSPDFIANPLTSCDGIVHFTNLTTNSPNSFYWDFGDGTFSQQENPTHVYTHNGFFTVTLTAENQFGIQTLSRPDYIFIQRPEITQITNDTICGPAQATLSAMGNGTIQWYNNPYDTIPLFTGETYVTNILDTNTVFYAELLVNPEYSAGAADTSIGNGGYYTGTNSHYLTFDCLKEIVLVSADVYAKIPGERTFILKRHNGTTIHDTTINLGIGKNTIYFNWLITPASNYRLIAAGPVFNLYRNTSGGYYPYSVSGILNITGNSYNPAYYYYFYNWKIKTSSCISPRIPVTAFVNTTPPTASFVYSAPDNTVYFTNTSSNAVSYFWDFGDGNFSTLQNPVHTYNNNGTYTVTLTAQNACGNSQFSQNIDVYSVGINDNSFISNLIITPNPASKYIFVEWYGKNNSSVNISLFNYLSETVYQKTETSIIGNNRKKIDISSLPQGFYYINITNGNCNFYNKLIKIF